MAGTAGAEPAGAPSVGGAAGAEGEEGAGGPKEAGGVEEGLVMAVSLGADGRGNNGGCLNLP
ncbi:hypothetical protein SCA03_61020 [Streptomyces cacaoi]|uniref:Uncharacterized protein n=1 Tax=Streptomyces cacaoi TaxID=1898 RepID=A0A4Y3R7E6_STRCI|nr:hypothetical protein SCA03_61020 [Streptomyces cacaoi]